MFLLPTLFFFSTINFVWPKLKFAKTELSNFKHSFFINTPKIYNKLPRRLIKDAQSLESFKIAIRKHYQYKTIIIVLDMGNSTEKVTTG